jgi:hypothetical protein
MGDPQFVPSIEQVSRILRQIKFVSEAPRTAPAPRVRQFALNSTIIGNVFGIHRDSKAILSRLYGDGITKMPVDSAWYIPLCVALAKARDVSLAFLERWQVTGWPNVKFPAFPLVIEEDELKALSVVAGKLNEAIEGIEPARRADPGIDFDALYEWLAMKERQPRLAILVRFMKDRETATFQDIIDGAYFGERKESTIRSYASLTTKYLGGIKSKLWFSTTQAHVVRHIDPV